jgi:hypothetical protein
MMRSAHSRKTHTPGTAVQHMSCDCAPGQMQTGMCCVIRTKITSNITPMMSNYTTAGNGTLQLEILSCYNKNNNCQASHEALPSLPLYTPVSMCLEVDTFSEDLA